MYIAAETKRAVRVRVRVVWPTLLCWFSESRPDRRRRCRSHPLILFQSSSALLTLITPPFFIHIEKQRVARTRLLCVIAMSSAL